MTWYFAHEIRTLLKANAMRRRSWPKDKIYYVNVNPLYPILIPITEDLFATDWEII